MIFYTDDRHVRYTKQIPPILPAPPVCAPDIRLWTQKAGTNRCFLDGPLEITETIRRRLIDNPKEIPPQLGSEYPIRTFHPKRGIEHKIITFQPDPNIDFPITVFNPQQKPGRLNPSEKRK